MLKANILVGVDGMAQDKSSRISLPVVSVKFQECKNVYPLMIQRPLGDVNKMERLRAYLDRLVKECNHLKCRPQFCADGPMRADLRGQQQHMSAWPCDMCFVKGEDVMRRRHDGKEQLGSKKCFPEPLDSFEARTHAKLLAFIGDKEDRHILRMSRERRRGVNARTPLLDLEMGFDAYKHIAPDAMHFICEGVVKHMLKMSIKITNETHEGCKARQLKAHKVEKLLKNIKVPFEFSRKPWMLTKGLKAEECRNTALCFFFCIVHYMEDHHQIGAWLTLAFLTRSYYLPEEEFRQTDETYRGKVIFEFLYSYKEAYGRVMCFYNTHLMRHLERIRKSGPLPDVSTTIFEANFAMLRKAIVEGTYNVPKSAMESLYLRLIGGHRCKRRMRIRAKATELTDDRILYRFEDGEYTFYKVVSKGSADKVWNVKKATVEPAVMPCFVKGKAVRELKWAKVGAYGLLCWGGKTQGIHEDTLSGKGVVVHTGLNKYIFSVPKNVLFEK